MEIPFSRWHPMIERRRSHREYDPLRPIPESVLEEVARTCNDFRPFSNVRALLIREKCEHVFKGIVGSYGKIKGAEAFIAFIGDTSDPNVQEKIGYLGEGIILEATALELDTCWVGGLFKKDLVASMTGLEKNEKVLSVTPVGYAKRAASIEEQLMAGFGLNHKRKSLTSIATGLEIKEWPRWVKVSIEAARLAPSAINRQPWGFYVEPDALTISVNTRGIEFNISKRLDCGIAMLHMEVAAMACGVAGKWEFLEKPLVARFTSAHKQK